MRVKRGREFIGRFKKGADLLDSLAVKCRKEGVTLGVFSVIGAVTGARMGYYLRDEQKYVECVRLDKHLELSSCIGNISLKGPDIFVHAHVTLADLEGRCYGGHLMPGTAIFAAEYHIKELTDGKLERGHDPETGLALWSV